ncbi:MAG: hypothetical protein AVDCRST_MAG49-581, partial [uncultured Thermomicrobiales bacterium]
WGGRWGLRRPLDLGRRGAVMARLGGGLLGCVAGGHGPRLSL